MKANIFSQGKKRVINFPSTGAYDLVTGLGYGPGTFGKSSWAFACMRMRATALAQMPWRLVRNDKVVTSHFIIELLQEFGPESSWADVIGATEIDMLRKGAAYWLFDADRLQRLNPNTVKVKRSSKGIQGFVQTIEGKQQTMIDRDDVAYFREYHPDDDLGPGVDPLSVVKQAVKTEYEANRYITAFFENDALPGLLMTTDQTVPQKEMNKLKAWWEEKFKGAKKSHKTAWVDRGLDAKILSSSLEEMALKVVRDEARRDICTAFQVPMVLVGSLDASNYATAKQARLMFIMDEMIPRAEYYASVINNELIQKLDPNVKFEFAFDELPILQEDKDGKALRLVGLLTAGAISPEFLRQEMGYPETAAPAEGAAALVPDQGAWLRKAMKSLKRGRNADVPFETDQLSLPLQAAIKAQLALAQTPGDVRAAFKAYS